MEPAPSVAAAHGPRPRPGARVYIVEGEIAAGKTELAQALAAALRGRGLAVALVLEPVEHWRAVGILQKFYGAPDRYGYSFQTYVFATRVLAIAAAVAAAPDADVYILERSPATDAVFMYAQRGAVDPVETLMYDTWCDAYRGMLPIDLSRAVVIYLRTSLGQCMARLVARSRGEEVGGAPAAPAAEAAAAAGGVSAEYQQLLRRLHEAFLLGAAAEEFPGLPKSPFPPASVVCVGPELADRDFRAAGPEQAAVLAEIMARVGL